MSTSTNSPAIPMFNGENYHIWAVKMKFVLRSQGLWNVVISEADPPPLRENPTIAQIKAYEEEKLKKDKKQVSDKIQDEFEGSSRVKSIIRLLTLKREFELMKMKDNESVKDYSGRLMDVVNQMRLLGETSFTDQKVVEKIMVSVPERFEAKISAIEESCDLQTLTITELTSKLHAQEQRVSIRSDEAVEGAFRAKHNGRNFGKSRTFNKNKGKDEGSSRKGNFLPCFHCQRTNHSKEDCWFKDKPLFHCNFCNKNGHSEKYCRLKKNQPEQQLEKQANVVEEKNDDEDEYLFMASQEFNSHELNTWLIDSGCTSHMTKYLSFFTSIDKSIKPKVKMGNGEIVQANGKGTISITTIVKDVLYIPKLDQNVLSVPQMLRNGYGVSFKENYCFIMDEHGLEIAKIEMTKNGFYLKFDLIEDHDFIAKIDMSNVWHGRFGHTFMQDVFDMTNSNKWYSKTGGGVRLNNRRSIGRHIYKGTSKRKV
uniref:Retrovirus-related Pol polyprotein from transposon TNT 1-94 n=1 Tax=Cajanus cajan TaxID=3821 RepID=A0A151RCS1_CAJCA|nr:Retrovirus-related Pol polyprotein from transposon TNT 1-94 [Cajanus cajan]